MDMSFNQFRNMLGLPNLVEQYQEKGKSGWVYDSDEPLDICFDSNIEKKEDGTECLVINW